MAVLENVIGKAVELAGRDLQREVGRSVEKGIHEVRELGPALRDAIVCAGLPPERIKLNHRCKIENWTKPTTEVDLVILNEDLQSPGLVAELKAWDIGHQLFDLAKVACLLGSGVPTGYLLCVARFSADFDRKPGGVLFPPNLGDTRRHTFRELVDEYRDEWRCHVGKNTPEPTAVPSIVTTTTVAADVEIAAYPGHSARAVEVRIANGTPFALVDRVLEEPLRRFD
jgi:hypothetical protein